MSSDTLRDWLTMMPVIRSVLSAGSLPELSISAAPLMEARGFLISCARVALSLPTIREALALLQRGPEIGGLGDITENHDDAVLGLGWAEAAVYDAFVNHHLDGLGRFVVRQELCYGAFEWCSLKNAGLRGREGPVCRLRRDSPGGGCHGSLPLQPRH